MTFEQFIKDNNKLIWAIVNNKNRKYYSHNFQKFLYSKYDKEDIYQELLTKIHKEYNSFNSMLNVKMTTFMTTVCVNHLSTLMQPYGAKKNQIKTTTKIDLDRFEDTNVSEDTMMNRLTIQELIIDLEGKPNEAILISLINGVSQSKVARVNNLSRQRIHQIWNEYKESVK
jgi:RNA polymerase sigma factor (sigma-70 family)